MNRLNWLLPLLLVVSFAQAEDLKNNADSSTPKTGKATSHLPDGDVKQIVDGLTTKIDATRDKVDDSLEQRNKALGDAVSEQAQ